MVYWLIAAIDTANSVWCIEELSYQLPNVCTGFGGGGHEMADVWKHLATQQNNGLEDNHKVNGAFGSLAGLYSMDPAAAYSMMPGMSHWTLVSSVVPIYCFTLMDNSWAVLKGLGRLHILCYLSQT